MKKDNTAMTIKVEISAILSMVKSMHHKYWLDDKYVKWGLVERDMHTVIEKSLSNLQ